MPITDLIPWRREETKVPVRREEDPMQVFQRDMNRLFDEFFGGFGLTPFGALEEPGRSFSPRVDVVDAGKEVRVSAELPGMEEKDVEVTLSSDMLTISGEKREEKEDRGKDYYRMERSYGSFRRSVPLHCEIEADKAEAVFKKGVLTITLPKTVESQECKRIAVRTG